MKYLIKTNELLLEPSFLKFAHQAYEGFIFLDEFAFMRAKEIGQTFEMTLDSWYRRCNSKEPTRVYSGTIATFKEYAGHLAQGRIGRDWENFEAGIQNSTGKDKDIEIKKFLSEVEDAMNTIPQRLYIAPIQEQIIKALGSIIEQYQTKQKSDKSINMNQPQRTKLKWRGDASALCAIFLDLRSQPMKKSEDKYLLARDPQLVQFILDNFEFLDSNNELIEKDETSIKRYVEGKDIKKRIKLDFSELTK